MELFFLNNSSDRGEGEWSEGLFLLDEQTQSKGGRLFRVENDVRQFFRRQQVQRIAKRQRIDRRTVEVGAGGYAARAGGRQH